MSRTLKLKPRIDIDLKDIIEAAGLVGIDFNHVDYDNRSYLLYRNGASARGIQISEEDSECEIRIAIMANEADYLLCRELLAFWDERFSCNAIDSDDGQQVDLAKYFDADKIKEYICSDAGLVFGLLSEGKNIDLFGPVREFSIGVTMREKLLKQDSLVHQVDDFFEMFLASQYPPESYVQFGSLMRVTNNAAAVSYLQVLANTTNMVIEKVDEYSISLDETTHFYIRPEHLKGWIPEEWRRLDESLILASVLPYQKWREFCDLLRQRSGAKNL